jgi:hypothetical protein
MSHADLHTFVRDALSRGIPREEVRRALLEARWSPDEVEAELAMWHDAGLAVPVPRRSVAISPREAFLHLLMFVALYLVAFHVGAVAFAWIRVKLPDPLVTGYDVTFALVRDNVRFSLATLLVAYPVFLLLSRVTSQAVERDPEKRNSGVRRWLTYLTLFNAACVLIGDFITTLLGLLKGELTAPFLAKVVVVAAIAGWLFSHYLGGLRREEAAAPRAAMSAWFARLASLGVIAAIVVAMWISGHPSAVRTEALDQQRVANLDAIAHAVQQYRRTHGVPPTTLTEVARQPDAGTIVLSDPVRRDPYAYTPIDSLRFELCATFDHADSLGPYGENVSPFWRHDAGRACFRFTYEDGVAPAVRKP